MRRLPSPILWLLLVGAMALLAACGSAAQPEAGENTQAAIEAAVQATLTAVAGDSQSSSDPATPAATPTPASKNQQTSAPVQLPPPIPGWEEVAKPGAERGDPDAPVLLVEYSDFQCPWCGRFESQVMPQLEPLIESGDLRFVYKHFPILGEASFTTALATECALVQGDFWSLHDWLFQNQGQWKGKSNVRELVLDAAQELGYDREAMDACMDGGQAYQAVNADLQESRQYGFRGTPSFILNGRLIPGFLPAERFIEFIQVFKAEALGEPLPEGYALAPTPPPLDLDFEPEEFAVDGNPDAPVVIVEFSDYQCPFCNRFFQETKPQLDAEYIDTGKVRFIYKDFPIDSIHAQARDAAQAAECAGAQDAYWAMHDRLFAGLQEWENNPEALAVFRGYAEELGLDMAAFNQCLDRQTYADEVQEDMEEGQRAGVTGTPTFFINGRKLVGAQPFSAFVQVIEDELSQ